MHRFKDLEIWQLSRSFCSEIYGLTSRFPNSEKIGLTNQLRRASVSVPSIIAEGTSRKSNKDFCRFLEKAVGSMYELETQLLLGNDLGYIQANELKDLLDQLQSIVTLTSRFKSTLE
jgi:four helix bundle protein